MFFAIVVLSLVSCNSKETLDLDPDFAREDFFRLFYTVNGEAREHHLLPTAGAKDSFTGPDFVLSGSDEDILAKFTFEWDGNVYFELQSNHPYFVDSYVYKLQPGSLVKINGWTFESGTFCFLFDRLYFSAYQYDSYSSFSIRFEGKAVNDSGESAEIKDGRLIFMRNVVNTMNKKDFTLFIYNY